MKIKPLYYANIFYKGILFVLLLFFIANNLKAQIPSIGQYQDTSIFCGQSLSILPSADPNNVDYIMARTQKQDHLNIKVNRITGEITLGNFTQIGKDTITVIAKNFMSNIVVETTFVLTIKPAICKRNRFEPTYLAISDEAFGAKTAYFNEDSFPDLALLNTNSNCISILLGTRNGPFDSIIKIQTGNKPIDFVIGDYNGDGNLDIAYCNYAINNFSICLGNGKGNFEKPLVINIKKEPSKIETADLNLDGFLDFVLMNRGGKSLSIYFGDGKGGISNEKELNLDYFPNSFCIGYFNPDNLPDIAVLNTSTNNYTQLLIFKGTDTGTYSIIEDTIHKENISHLYKTDLNGDGFDDLMGLKEEGKNNAKIFSFLQSENFKLIDSDIKLNNKLTNAVKDRLNLPNNIFHNNINSDQHSLLIVSSDNNLFFYDTAYAFIDSLKLKNYISSTCIGDFNQDGILDMLCTLGNYDSLVIIYGLNDLEVFSGKLSINTGDIDTYKLPKKSKDLDTFSKSYQLVNYGNSSITLGSLYLNGIDSSDFKLNYLSKNILQPNDTLDFQITFTQNPGKTNRNVNVNIPYVDCGGTNQFIHFSITLKIPPIPSVYDSITLVSGSNYELNPKVGPKYTDRAIANTSSNFKGTILVDHSTGKVQITNANPPGRYYINISVSNVSEHTNNTGFILNVLPSKDILGVFDCKKYINEKGLFVASEIIDINHDGHQDIVLLNFDSSSLYLLINDSNGGFRNQKTLKVGLQPTSLVTGDFNEDGEMDIITSNYKSQTLSILLGKGNLDFEVSQINTQSTPKSVISFDTDNDRHLDLLVSSYEDNQIVIYNGHGDGTFTPENAAMLTTEGRPYELFKGNFQNKDTTDFGIIDFDHGKLQIFNGDSYHSTSYPIDKTLHPISASTADIDNNGFLDIILANWNSDSITVLLNQSKKNFKIQTTQLSFKPNYIQLADMDHDGIIDLLASSIDSQSFHILKGKKDGTFGPTLFKSPALNIPLSFQIGDFNEDGYQDIVVNGKNSIFILSGSSTFMMVKGNNETVYGQNLKPTPNNGTFIIKGDTQLFEIQNKGLNDIMFQSNSIEILGVDAKNYKLFKSPFSVIKPNENEEFRITDTSKNDKINTATVIIYKSNCTEAPYKFNIASGNTFIAAQKTVQSPKYDINIVPNPNKGEFSLNMSTNFKGKLNYELSDMLGQTIFSNHQIINSDNTSIPLNFSNLKEGAYIIKTDYNGIQSFRRFIIIN